MRIGLITSSMDERRAGIGYYSYNLVKNLTKIDKKNDYVLIHHYPTNDEIYKENKELTIPYPRIPLRKTIGNNIILAWKLRSHDFDIVHDLSQISPFLFSSHFKKILTIHDLTPILFSETYGLIHVFLQKHVLPMTLKNIDMIITVSEHSKQDIINHLKIPEEKIKVIYNGIDGRFKPLKKVDDVKEKYDIKSPFILYVGTLEPRKNIPTLINAFYELKKNGILYKLVIVGGKGWKYKDIYEHVDKLNLQREVIFTGYVSDDDLPKLYNAADLFIYPSLYEGFGFPPLEAMACGCPVITSNTSSLPEVVGDAGMMVDPYDVDEIANAMKRVLLDENLREEMIKKGLERAKKFRWENCADETIRVYEFVGCGGRNL